MSLIKNSFQHGDTLVEVLFATAVFSLVAVSCMSIMNQGAATAQRALEISLVRNEIDAQAETLRFLNASYIAAFPNNVNSGPASQWKDMQEYIVKQDKINGSDDNTTNISISNCSNSIPADAFILNAHQALFNQPEGNNKPVDTVITFSQVNYNSDDNISSAQGIWIETARVWPEGDVGYIDFHIRACWDSPGQSMPVTLGTIVRLYEPHL